ncbi:unnamed protein product, partial [Heterosigma akashiwo]
EVKNQVGFNILQVASMENDLQAVKVICQHRAVSPTTINAVNPDTGNTNLHWAATHGNVELAEVLLGSGAQAGKQNKAGETCLFRAIQYNHSHFIKFILHIGRPHLSPNTPNLEGISPLRYALQQDR